jgi:hypothetical protein
MTAPQSHKRRDILSNPSVQLRIIGIFLFLAVLYAATGYYVTRNTLGRAAADIMRLPLSDMNRHDVATVVREHALTLDIQLTLFIFLSIVTVTMCGVLLSHLIGGPIYRINKYLKEVSRGEGKMQPIRFRKSDFFQDLAQNFNDFQRATGILNQPESGTPREGEATTESGNPKTQPPAR